MVDQGITIYLIGHNPCNWHVTERMKMKHSYTEISEYQYLHSCNWHVTDTPHYIGYKRDVDTSNN